MRKSRRSTPTVSRCPHPPPPASHLQPAPTTAQLHAAFRLPPSFTCGAYTRVRKCLYARAYAARTDHQQKVCTHARTQRVRKFCTHARTRACGTLPALDSLRFHTRLRKTIKFLVLAFFVARDVGSPPFTYLLVECDFVDVLRNRRAANCTPSCGAPRFKFTTRQRADASSRFTTNYGLEVCGRTENLPIVDC